MQVIKLYLPMKDNDKNDVMSLHGELIRALKHRRLDGHKDIEGFTRFEAEGHWFSTDGDHYLDEVKIYEFHIKNENISSAYKFLKRSAELLCGDMKQECIYLQLNNDTELVRADND